MITQPPPLDTRRAEEVVSEVEKALRIERIAWQGVEGGAGYALARLFGRLSELVVNRLNRIPKNHFREFLNTAGIDLLPPRNASVDLSFFPFEDGPDVVFVPAGTQTNTQPSESSPNEVIFETEKDLNVFNNSLAWCIAFDPNTYADRTKEANGLIAEDFPVFEGRKDKERERVLFLSDRKLFDFPDHSTRQDSTITLTFEFDPSLDLSAERWRLDWLYWDWDADKQAGQWKPMPDDVLDKNADGVFKEKGQVSLRGIPALYESSVGGIAFSLGNHLLPDLDRGILSANLRQAFKGYGVPLAPNATLTTIKEGEIWQVVTGDRSYTIEKKAVLEVKLDPVTAPWIACRLIGDAAGVLPSVKSIKGSRKIEIIAPRIAQECIAFTGIQANMAFVAIPNTRDEFYPFGQVPGRLDTFYLSADEAFSKPGALVTIALAGLEGIPKGLHAETQEAQVERRKDIDALRIVWEYHSSDGWQELGSSALVDCLTNQGAAGTGGPGGGPTAVDFEDTTCAFTGYGSPPAQYIQFKVPTSPGFAKTTIAERNGYWIRARLVSGSYILRAYMEQIGLVGGPYVFKEAQIYAPLIKDLRVGFQGYSALDIEQSLSLVRGLVDGIYRDYPALDAQEAQEPAAVFTPRETGPAFYMGFSRAFPGRKWVSLLLDVVAKPGVLTSPQLISWEYWNGSEWSGLEASDASQGLTVRQYLGFYAPDAHQPSVEFGHTAFWLRARPIFWRAKAGYRTESRPDDYIPHYYLEASGTGSQSPVGRHLVAYHWRMVRPEEEAVSTASFTQRLKTIGMNVVQAANAETTVDEVLGSSNGEPGQVFRLARTPVLATGVILEVREPDRPPKNELDTLRDELSATEEDDKPTLEALADSTEAGWVRWRQVSHFYDSGKDSRHYVLDPTSGEVRFGDGVRGQIPPPGRDNIKVARYRAHSGSAGNVAAGAITVLRNPSDDLANIRGVINREPAAGGSVEDVAEAEYRGPQTLRHRRRAVTKGGYRWLVQEVGSQVARANGVLARTPDGQPMAGCVDVVVVPKEKREDIRPVPDPALLREVKNYLNERALVNLAAAGEQIQVKGAEYTRVSVSARVVPENPEKSDRILNDVIKRLQSFLHPLVGGPDGSGWSFGRDVYRSEIASVIESVAGVDHVSTLHLSASQCQSRLELAESFAAPYDLPAGSQVSTFDDRIKLVLVESVFGADQKDTSSQWSGVGLDAVRLVDTRMTGDPSIESAHAPSLVVVGFKVGDQVVLVDDHGNVLQDDLTIAYLIAESIRITFEDFALPEDWDRKGTLRSLDDRTNEYPVMAVDGAGMTLWMAPVDQKPLSLDALEHLGFWAGDKVMIVNTENRIMKSNLTVERVAEETIRVGLEPSLRPTLHGLLKEGSSKSGELAKKLALRSKNGPRIQQPLVSDPTEDGSDDVSAVTVQNLVVNDRVSVVVDGRRHPSLELLTIKAVDRRDDRIFVPEDYLVFSAKHDIRMVLE